jgi:hypothetical protein
MATPETTFAGTVIQELLASVDRTLSLAEQLGPCDYSDEFVSSCSNFATIHLIKTEEDLCKRHFEKRLREL